MSQLTRLDGKAEFLDVGGVKLEIERHRGNSEAPTLVFLHEGLGCVELWKGFPEKVAQLTGCSILAYSRQGYGRSDPCVLPRPLSYMHHEALDVLPQLLDTAGVGEYVLVGHSDGGSIALIHSGGIQPKGLRGVITMAPHVFCEDLSVQSIAEAKQAYVCGTLRGGLAKYHENVDCAFWGWNGAWLDPDFFLWNIEEYLPGINVPQLILQGENDQYGTVSQVQSIVQQAGGPVEVCMLPDCGHSPFKEQQTRSLAAMKDFLDSVLQASIA